jgi:hypothetical protein
MRIIFISICTLAICGCYFSRHHPTRAASDANSFLKALYLDHNYEAAWDLGDDTLHKSASVETLERMSWWIEDNSGQLEELKAESYTPPSGDSIELFYVGRYEKGVLYHRLLLVGDASKGYRVSGVWFRDSPYPQLAPRHPFEINIVVK